MAGRRLRTSFGDLLQHPRYADAALFFVEELYGAHDVTWRDRDLRRMLPTLRTLLPTHTMGTVVSALDLDLLSHEFDLAVADALQRQGVRPDRIGEADYAAAYQAAGDRPGRERQLDLLVGIGHEIDRLVRSRLIVGLLHLAHGPAHAAGLGRLHKFLQRGFDSFGTMKGADEFLAEISKRERNVMTRLFAGDPDPFRPGKPLGA